METMEIKESNLRAAYAAADESVKSLLRTMFPDANLGNDTYSAILLSRNKHKTIAQ